MRVKDLVAPEAEDISTDIEGLLLARRLYTRSRGEVQKPLDYMQAKMGDYRQDPGFLGLGESSEVSYCLI